MSRTNRQYERKKATYYNNDYLIDIMYLCELDLKKAVDKLYEYIEHYPQDYSSYCLLATHLITLRRYEEAEKLLDIVEEKYSKENMYGDYAKEKGHIINLCIAKIRLYSYTNRFHDCIQYIKKNASVFGEKKASLKALRHYCLVNLTKGTDKYKLNPENGYIYHQIYEYSEEEFRKHIQKHTIDYELEENEETAGFFFKEFPLDEVVEEVKKYIPNQKYGYCSGSFEDAYYFKYDICGKSMANKDRKNAPAKNYKSKKLVVDYIKVVTLHDTPNMITMCPCEGTDGLPYIDLNYMKIREEPKVMKKSAIDKFNERYKNSIDKK